ncbi:MAG: hypothetical protein QM713_00225 [Arachnia sp.]
MQLLMDESGNGNPDDLLLVGGVAVGPEIDSIEAEMQALYRRWAAQETRFDGLPSFAEFKRRGFHGTQMPLEVQVALVDFLASRLDFKVFMLASDRTRMPDLAEGPRLVLMYLVLLTDIIIRFRKHSQIALKIEENDQLRPHLATIVERALARARLKSAVPIGANVTIAMVPKNEPMATSIIDLYLLTASKWLQAGARRDGRDYAYRNFAALESSVSLLKSFETGVLSTRASRLAL